MHTILTSYVNKVAQLRGMGPWSQAQVEVALAASKGEMQPAFDACVFVFQLHCFVCLISACI